MKKPVIQLKNIKHSEFASEETNCYQATVYVDGKRFATVSNQGFGGCDDVHPLDPYKWEDVEALEKRIKATYESTTHDLGNGKPFVMEPSLKGICGDLLTEWLITKDAKKTLKKCTTFNDGKISTWGTVKSKAAAILHVQKVEPTAIILNNLAFDEALEIFKQHG